MTLPKGWVYFFALNDSEYSEDSAEGEYLAEVDKSVPYLMNGMLAYPARA